MERQAFFSADEWAAMPALFQRRWAKPTEAYIKAHAAAPEAPELKQEFLRCLRGALKPEWIPPDLEQRLVYLKRGEGEESLASSYFYGRYARGGDAFDIRGRFMTLEVMIQPARAPRVGASTEVVRALDAAWRGRGVGEATAAAEGGVAAFLRGLWERYANLPTWDARPAAGDHPVRAIQRGLVTPSAPFRPPGAHWRGWASLWTDGSRVRLLVGKPDTVWTSPLARRFRPRPVPPTTQPLNPEDALYEDTRRLLDKRTMPVSDEQRAYKTILRIIYRHQSESFISSGYFVRLPVTDEKWRLCEYHALTRYICHRAQAALYCPHVEAQLVDPFQRRRGVAAMASSMADYRHVRADFDGLKYPGAAEAHHGALVAALKAGQRAWDIAKAKWDKALRESPEGGEREYAEVAASITAAQREEACDSPQLRRQLDDCMRDFTHLLWERWGIDEGVEAGG